MSLAPAAGIGAVLAPARPVSGRLASLGVWLNHRQPCYGRFPVASMSLRTCFCGTRKSSMFCRNAARQSHGRPAPAVVACPALSAVLASTPPARNDL